jgi:uncharacterized protein YhfF
VTESDADQRDTTPPGDVNPGLIAAFWERFVATAGIDPTTPVPSAWCFGDTVELANELIELVLSGPKRATAGAVAEYEADGDPIPEVGDFSIVTDGAMRPRAVVQTTDVSVGPLSSVDDRFAWDEGEGDRTRRWWLEAHTRFFSRTYTRMGLEFDADIPVVFERFTVRYREV